jgi:hypothetical protein
MDVDLDLDSDESDEPMLVPVKRKAPAKKSKAAG